MLMLAFNIHGTKKKHKKRAETEGNDAEDQTR